VHDSFPVVQFIKTSSSESLSAFDAPNTPLDIYPKVLLLNSGENLTAEDKCFSKFT
jgi:hypothetical protein